MMTKYKYERNKQLADAAKKNLETLERRQLKLSDGFIKWKGGKLRLKLIESGLIQKIIYQFNIQYLFHKYSKSYRRFILDEVKHLLPENEYMDMVKKGAIDGLIADILKCNKLYMSSPEEYFLYGFKYKTAEERAKYVTDKYLLSKLSMTGMRKKHDVELNEKYNFYLLTKPFFARNVLILPPPHILKAQYLDFFNSVHDYDRLIFKPTSLGCGDGIFIADVRDEESVKKVYERISNSNVVWVAEELINQVKEMAEWNESSVNTIRVNTFCKNGIVELGTSFMRTGRKGSDVDNAGVGGIYAIVDTITGRLITDGRDERNNRYVSHPDSNIEYKGWQVPRWQELVEMSKVIHSIVFPKMVYVSWDFALTDEGWVVIEGNWGQFVAQQSALGYGLRHEFDRYIK